VSDLNCLHSITNKGIKLVCYASYRFWR